VGVDESVTAFLLLGLVTSKIRKITTSLSAWDRTTSNKII